MPDEPRRKKTPRSRPARRRKKPRRAGSRSLFSSSPLDLRTLIVLSVGDWSELADPEWPPEDITAWIEQANIRELHGVLLATLQRWHDLPG